MIAFFGTPEFAAVHLEGLLAGGLPIGLVVTRPDRPRGRGRAVEPSPVRAVAASRGIESLAPERARDPAFVEGLRARAPALILVVAYGGILPREVLAIPPLGAVNLHASLLPRWRGAAPVAWALLAGDGTTGVTSFFLEEGIDTGEMILARETPIGPTETAGELTARLAVLGRDVLVETARLVQDGWAPRRPQGERGVTHAPRLEKEDGWIPWHRSAEEIARFTRGMTPWPGARSRFRGEPATFLATSAIPGRAKPGGVVAFERGAVVVGTGSGLLRIDRIQMAGKRVVSGEEFARGARPREGEEFLSPQGAGKLLARLNPAGGATPPSSERP